MAFSSFDCKLHAPTTPYVPKNLLHHLQPLTLLIPTHVGVTGKMSTQGKDEDDNFGTEASQKAILRALGTERFNRVFSGLYVCRHGSSLVVRQAALHVWKVIVSHTPRTLRDIMPTLFNLLLHHLASSSYDKRQVRHRRVCLVYPTLVFEQVSFLSSFLGALLFLLQRFINKIAYSLITPQCF